MKKILKFLFLFTFCFLIYKNVYATSRADVCSSCEYRTLDQAFSAIQDGYLSDDYVVLSIMDPSGSYSFNQDYHFQQSVCLYQDGPVDGTSITIDGRGHTITSNGALLFVSVDVKLIAKNINESVSNLNFPFALSLTSYLSTVSADNITINNSDRLRSDSSSLGIFINSHDFTISNSTISNFAIAISNNRYFYNWRVDDSISSFDFIDEEIGVFGDGTNTTSVSINSSDLYDNMFTFDGAFKGNIKNSRISSFTLFNEDETNTNLFVDSSNDYGDVKIKRISIDDYYSGDSADLSGGFIKSSPSSGDIYDQILNHDYLFVITDRYSNVEIEAKKNNSFNINNTKSVDLLSYFIDQEDINLRDYEFNVSDPSVAAVENGQVVFLKSGEVDVTATNKKTGDVYTVHLKLESPKTSSNPKTSNSLLILLAITILTLSSLFIFHKKQTSTL